MKKLLCALLCLSLLISAASAEGLGGLSGGLSGLIDSMSEQSAALPDPAAVLGTPGTLLQANYQFALDYLCDAYTYPMPGDMQRFLDDYTALAVSSGFSVSETTADGLPAYRLDQASSGLYALLVPEFQGRVLLLVDVGMAFDGSQASAAAPATTPEPEEEEEEYVRFDLNGREVNLPRYECSIHDGVFDINFSGSRMIFRYLWLQFPSYAQEGDVFIDTRDDKVEDMSLYVIGTIDNSTFEDFLVYDSPADYNHDEIHGANDHFSLTVESMKEDDTGIDLVLTFEGVFNRGEWKMENGRLHAYVYK